MLGVGVRVRDSASFQIIKQFQMVTRQIPLTARQPITETYARVLRMTLKVIGFSGTKSDTNLFAPPASGLYSVVTRYGERP